MNIYCTEIKALDYTGRMSTWCGPNIEAISFKDAQDYCENNGLGYCKVVGLLVSEIPCKSGSYEADFSKEIDYTKYRLN